MCQILSNTAWGHLVLTSQKFIFDQFVEVQVDILCLVHGERAEVVCHCVDRFGRFGAPKLSRRVFENFWRDCSIPG